MSGLDDILEQYKHSVFYKKYIDSHNTYKVIHQMNSDLIRDLINMCAGNKNEDENKFLWKAMMDAFYIDPDLYVMKRMGNVECTADGLFSIERIYGKYGMNEKTAIEYERYRKKPIFFFPRERHGINMTRYSVFGDRIDYTLYDLKMCLKKINEKNDIKDCKLYSAYIKPRTGEWLNWLNINGSFKKLVEAYGIKGIFVNENYEVYDIEKGNGEPIGQYETVYSKEWSDAYYNNLKALVDKIIDKNEETLPE